MDTTEIVIEKKQFTIKSGQYKNLPDETYSCEIQYLPLTKIIFDANIHNAP